MSDILLEYDEIKEYLKAVSNAGIVLGLEPIKELLNRLSNPQDGLKFVHVAGTNGKGSTIAYISSILRAAGYKTGVYTSPCVFSEFEKYEVGGEYISEADYIVLMNEVIDACSDMKNEGLSHPTIFEMETAAAFLYFYRCGCTYAVIETGMGGREDATNIIVNTEVSVLTSIAMDHMKFLGNTVEEIACQKGGIIKPGKKAVLYKQDERAADVIKGICREVNAALYICDPSAAINSAVYDEEKGMLCFSYEGHDFATGMLGRYQAANASVAIVTACALRDCGAAISDNDISEGIKNAAICGRFEFLSRKPEIIIDGAHNPDAAVKLSETIKMYFTNRRLLYIMGVLADKDFDKVAETLVYMADTVYTVTPDNPRALKAESLSECVGRYCDKVYVKASISEAVRDAVQWAGDDGVVIAFGSLSYIGEVKDTVKEIQSDGQG